MKWGYTGQPSLCLYPEKRVSPKALLKRYLNQTSAIPHGKTNAGLRRANLPMYVCGIEPALMRGCSLFSTMIKARGARRVADKKTPCPFDLHWSNGQGVLSGQ